MRAQAETVLRDYVALQERLCKALFDRFPVKDTALLTDLPRRGLLPLGDTLWEFNRHGTGICFSCVSASEIVDAHAEPVAHPRGIDAWRLIHYLESRGIEALTHGGAEFDATREKSVEEMLRQLFGEDLLTVSDFDRRIYSLP